MKIAIIGRSEILFETAELLRRVGHEIVCIITAKEAPEYTKKSKDFQNLATKFEISFFHTPQINKIEDKILVLKPDIGVSFNYTGIIPQNIINCFPNGILNAHSGDLPRYRGNACQAWALINGEKKIGLCIHKMEGGELDSGDIIEREYLKVDHNTKITESWIWMKKKVPLMYVEALQKLEKNANYILEKQDIKNKNVIRCYPRKPEDGKIEWNKSSIDVIRLINASNLPYEGAFCFFKQKKLIIWDASIIEDNERFFAVPGQITAIKKSNVEVACGQNKICINKVEYENEISTPNKWIKSIRNRLY